MKLFTSILLLILILSGISGFAQERIDKEIVVVKPYEPTLSDAHKINILPEITDTLSVKPEFKYSIFQKKYETGYQVRPIKAANMVGEPLEKLYKSYLKLGVGNYLVPMAELNINSLRSRDRSFGLYMKHNSINGKIKLDDGQKVHTGFSENIVNLYGKKVFKRSVLSGNISPNYYGINFYGFNTDSAAALDKKDIKQNYLFADAGIKMKSAYKDSLHLNYDLAFNYGLTLDKFSNSEHAFRFSSGFNKLFDNQVFGLEARFSHYLSGVSIDSVNNTIISLTPWFSRTTPEFGYRLGLNMVNDIHNNDVKFYLHPLAYLQIKVIDKIMIPYFGVEGILEENYFGKIARENMYISPGLPVENTNNRIKGFIGIKGNYTSKLNYHLNFEYSLTNNMYFFINDTSGIQGNKFLVVYDDVECLQGMVESTYKPSDKLNFTLKGNYYHYNLDSLEYAWHKPGFDIVLNARYNVKNKILIEGSLFYLDKRYAMNPLIPGIPVSLKGYPDLSLGLEYRYTSILSGFIRLNNLFGINENLWLYYPSMRFNLLVGFTYAL